MERTDELQAQLRVQSLGKGNLKVGKDDKASVPPVSTDSNINPPVQSTQPGYFLNASGKNGCRHAQLASLIQPTKTLNQFSPLISNE